MYRILLIGDSCTDAYVYGRCLRISPEAPVPVLTFSQCERRPGMAANVAANLAPFGVDLTFLTQAEPILKTRYVDERYHQQMLRVDQEPAVQPLASFPDLTGYDALVISDYDKGFLTQEFLHDLVDRTELPTFIDTKKNLVPVRERCFVKINEAEFARLRNPSPDVIVTLGDRGARYRGIDYPVTERISVFDVVGAGDTFLAALAYFYLAQGSIEEAIPYANRASVIAVQHPGTYALSVEDVAALRAPS